MMGMLERLESLRVRDLMSTDAITIDQNETLGSAAAAMMQRPISGVPVVDEAGHCVGMLTAFDFVRRYAAERDEERAALGGEDFRLVPGSEQEPLEVGPASLDLVASNMTEGVQSISQHASLLEAAREMCALHVHRLPVLDAHENVEGILTSLDIVAAVINAAEEQSQAVKKRKS